MLYKQGRNLRNVKTPRKYPEFKSSEIGFCNSESKLERRTKPRTKQRFDWEITLTNTTALRIVLGSSFGQWFQ
jgi:hypothetical protein